MYYRINYLSTTRVDMDGSCVMGCWCGLRTVAVARVWLAHRPTHLCNAPLIAIEAPRQQQHTEAARGSLPLLRTG